MLYCTYLPSYVGIPVSVTSFSIPSFSISLSLYELFFLTHTLFFFFFSWTSLRLRERKREWWKAKKLKKLKSMCCSKVGEWESFDDFCAVLVGTDRVSQRLEMEWKLIPGRGHLSNMLFFFFSFGLKFEWKGKGQKDLNSLIL